MNQRVSGVPGLDRRGVLRVAAGALALGGWPRLSDARTAAASELPDEQIGLLVAGPPSAVSDQWADALLPELQRGFSPMTRFKRENVGAVDGVTGANQFETRDAPDGLLAMAMPGSAAAAWLVGDPRARYDAARWLPVISAVTTCVLYARPALSAFAPGTLIRLAAASPASPDLAAILALDLLGMDSRPVFGLTDATAVEAAVRSGVADAVAVFGADVAGRAPALSRAGLVPLASLGALSESGTLTREPAWADLPHVSELLGRYGRPTTGPLVAAWRAALAAVQLDTMIILPQLTSASAVARWRRAAAAAMMSEAAAALGGARATRPLTGAAAVICGSTIVADSNSVLDLRRWLTSRFGWRPA